MQSRPVCLKSIANKENSHQRPRPKCPARSILEQQAMERLNQLSEIDVNRLNSKESDGFTAWRGGEINKENQHKQAKQTCYHQSNPNTSSVKFRGFSFWRRSESRAEAEKERDKTDAKEQRRNTVNFSLGRQYRTTTEENIQKVSSNEIFVRKFPRKERSHVELAKRYVPNSVFREDISQAKARSFESQSKTVFVKRRPRTGASSSNLTGVCHDFTRHSSFDRSEDPKVKLERLIAESEKMLIKEKRKPFSKKLERDSERKNNPFFKILKEKYRFLVYGSN